MKKLKVTLNGKSYEVDVEILHDDDTPTMPYIPIVSPIAATPPPASTPKTTTTKPPPTSSSDNSLTAPMNGVVIEILVKPGDKVTTNQVVIVLEAMKMKTNISSPRDGTIATVDISANDSIETGQIMLTYA